MNDTAKAEERDTFTSVLRDLAELIDVDELPTPTAIYTRGTGLRIVVADDDWAAWLPTVLKLDPEVRASGRTFVFADAQMLRGRLFRLVTSYRTPVEQAVS